MAGESGNSVSGGAVPFYVAVPTHGRASLLGKMLAHLAELERPENFRCVMVMENGTPCGAEQVCREAGSGLPVEYHHVAQAGRNRALQAAFDKVGNGFVLILDDDIRPGPRLLTAYAEAARRHGVNAVYGGPIGIDYEQRPAEWLMQYLPVSATGYEPRDPANIKGTQWFIGLNHGLFAERLREAGGLNLAMGPGVLSAGSPGNPLGDEMELQARLYKQGCDAVFVPEGRVWHFVPAGRCSPGWALDRHYRVAMTNAMWEGRGAERTPAWLWRKIAGASVKAGLGGCLPGERRRFLARRDYYRWTGYRRGLLMAGQGTRGTAG